MGGQKQWIPQELQLQAVGSSRTQGLGTWVFFKSSVHGTQSPMHVEPTLYYSYISSPEISSSF